MQWVNFADGEWGCGEYGAALKTYRTALQVSTAVCYTLARGLASLGYGIALWSVGRLPEAARSLIALPEDRVTTVTHNRGDANAYADLWLMTHATHFVIANSTFSWWGAWLAERSADQIVIAPGFRMRE